MSHWIPLGWSRDVEGLICIARLTDMSIIESASVRPSSDFARPLLIPSQSKFLLKGSRWISTLERKWISGKPAALTLLVRYLPKHLNDHEVEYHVGPLPASNQWGPFCLSKESLPALLSSLQRISAQLGEIYLLKQAQTSPYVVLCLVLMPYALPPDRSTATSILENERSWSSDQPTMPGAI